MVPGPTNEAAFLVVPRWKSMSLGRPMLGLAGPCRGAWKAWLALAGLACLVWVFPTGKCQDGGHAPS